MRPQKTLRPLTVTTLKWIAISTGLLLISAVIFWKQIMHFAFHDLPFMGENFNQPLWSSALNCKADLDCMDKEMACVRGKMYRDLEANHLLTGMPRNAVIQLLGNPTPHPTKQGCIDYELGYCSGLKMDADYLRVCFDEQEKIQRVHHWQG